MIVQTRSVPSTRSRPAHMVAHADNGTALIRPATFNPAIRQLIMSLDHDHPEIVS